MDEQAKQRIREIVTNFKDQQGSQGRAALLLGVSPGTIRNWTDGISYPDLDGFIAISKALGISLMHLLTEILGEEMTLSPEPETAENILFQAKKLSSKEKLRLILLLSQQLLED